MLTLFLTSRSAGAVHGSIKAAGRVLTLLGISSGQLVGPRVVCCITCTLRLTRCNTGERYRCTKRTRGVSAHIGRGKLSVQDWMCHQVLNPLSSYRGAQAPLHMPHIRAPLSL